jgi:hypothetical protein
METWNHWQKDGLGSSAITPLHQNLHKQAGKRVLTRTVVGSAVVLGIEEGNDGERGWRRCPAAAQARGRHKELMRTLGRQWAAQREGAHRLVRVAVALSDMEDDVGGRWSWFLEQNNRTTTGISYARGIAKWQGGAAASWQWRSNGSLPRHGEKLQKGEEAWAGRSLLFPGGEREGCVVLHVSDRTPASSRTNGAKRMSSFPYSESLTGARRSAFERWHQSEAVSGHTVHRPGPLNLISYFFPS